VKRVLVSVLFLALTAEVLHGADVPELPKKKISVGPFDLTLGYDKGLAGTLKGDYVTALGDIASQSRFTWGSTMNVDAVGNTSAKKADNATLAAGLGRVSVDPRSFFPALAGFLQVQAKSGQVARTSGTGFDHVNQVALGGTVEWVPSPFITFIMQGHRPSVPLLDVERRCNSLSAGDRAKDPQCQLLDCSLLSADQLKDNPTCKALIDAARKKEGAIEAPPTFVLGYFHPLRTSGGDIGDLPNGIDANKVTLEFVADNHLPHVVIYRDKTLHVTANLSATYPTTGSDKKVQGKVDIGLGIDLTPKFTPIVKYVSGKKDGFTYDKSVIVGFLLNLAKLKTD
jgi:hypothetical protein